MHILFTDTEKKWIDTKKFGWPILEGCPKDIEEAINKKKQIIDNQNNILTHAVLGIKNE